jgi:hypothetical protein
MKLTVVLSSLFIFILAGCDPAYSIRRDSDQLNYNISSDCLTSSIDHVPNSKISSDRLVRPEYFCKEGQTSRQITYSIDEQLIFLRACYDGELLKTFSQEIGGHVGGQKKQNVPAILTKMRTVESSIETRCNAKGFSAKIKNNCTRIECND